MASKGKGKNDDLKQEELLQAIVIADSFNVRFAPATDKKPRVLLPLVNVPILDYTLELLAINGIQETLVFCCHHANQIRAHLRDSKWTDGKSSMLVKTILSEGCGSVGEVLREVDSRSLIRGDFFLLFGDTVCSMELKSLMAEHKERRERIKSCVMTATYKPVPPTSRMRCKEENVVMMTCPKTQRICHYQMQSFDTKIRVPHEVFLQHADVELHSDLLDAQLYVCSPSVLHLFTDNFDFCTMEDFIKGLLISEEILGSTVHVNLKIGNYCARASNPYMYHVISQDILRAWTTPIDLKRGIGSNTDSYECRSFHIYKSKDAVVASGVKLVRHLVIGSGTTIATDTVITNSAIGRNCEIGAHVTMENSYVWDNVTIEDGCVLKNCIICDGVTVFANTTVQQRTILSWNVKVGPDVTLPSDLRLQESPQKDEFADDDDEDNVPEVTPEYGAKSRAFPFNPDSDSDDEGDPFFADWGDVLVSKDKTPEDDGDSDSEQSDESDEEEIVEEDPFESFYKELIDTLKRAKEENVKTDNLILEVNSLKHAYNIAISDVHQAVIKVLVDMVLKEKPSAPIKDVLTAMLKHIERHKDLLTNYINKRDAQLDCLNSLEDFALENDRVLVLLPKVVHHLYNIEILEEAAIVEWFDMEPDDVVDEEEHARVRKQLQAFVTWLKEAEEESEEDSD